MLHIQSISDPFQSPALASQALRVLGRADAMGLLPSDAVIPALDLAAFQVLLQRIQAAGIGRQLRPEMGLQRLLAGLNQALEESPAPATEWPRAAEWLGSELLAQLLGVSASSLRRYREGARPTPDDVAGRLHYLSLVAGDLAGAYNEFGIRQWFLRKRVQLENRTPLALLRPGWSPSGTDALRVQQLAHALTFSPAT